MGVLYILRVDMSVIDAHIVMFSGVSVDANVYPLDIHMPFFLLTVNVAVILGADTAVILDVDIMMPMICTRSYI